MAERTSRPAASTVWINTSSGYYHKPDSRHYGKTKHGKYMTESDAISLMNTFQGLADRIVAISSADVYRSYELLRHGVKAAPDPEPLAPALTGVRARGYTRVKQPRHEEPHGT